MRDRNQIFSQTKLVLVLSLILSRAAWALETSPNIKIFTGAFYKVEKVEGSGSYRLPFVINWKPLRPGLILPLGSSLQIQAQSKVDISYRYKNAGQWRGSQTNVLFEREVTLNLDEQFLRKVNIKTYFATAVKAKDTVPNPKDEELDFQRAWNRVVTYFRDTSNFSPQLTQGTTPDLKLALRQQKITVLIPDDGMTRFVERFPTPLHVVWANPFQATQTFKVFMWPYSEPIGQPVAQVRGESYQLMIRKPGSYLVKITTLNERFSSAPILVHYTKEIPEILDEKIIDRSDLKLLFPPDNFVFLPPNRNASLPFMGEIAGAGDKLNKTLHIKRSSGPSPDQDPGISIALEGDFNRTVPLAANEYEWWVSYEIPSPATTKEGPGEAPKPQSFTSGKRRLTIIEDSKSALYDFLNPLITSSLEKGTYSQIYLSKINGAGSAALPAKQ